MNLNNHTEVAAVLAEIGCFEWPKSAADGAAATATAETMVGVIGPGPSAIALGAVQYAPAAALTSDATNIATITVNKRTLAAPGTAVPIAVGATLVTGTNATGSWTAWKAVSLTVQSGAGSFVSPGDTITVAITKGGTGVVVPQGILVGYPTQT